MLPPWLFGCLETPVTAIRLRARNSDAASLIGTWVMELMDPLPSPGGRHQHPVKGPIRPESKVPPPQGLASEGLAHGGFGLEGRLVGEAYGRMGPVAEGLVLGGAAATERDPVPNLVRRPVGRHDGDATPHPQRTAHALLGILDHSDRRLERGLTGELPPGPSTRRAGPKDSAPPPVRSGLRRPGRLARPGSRSGLERRRTGRTNRTTW